MEVLVVKKFKQIATVALIGALLSAGVAPSHAATLKVKQGSACVKAGAKAKVGSLSYVCGVLPTTTSKKRVWVLTDCLVAYKIYVGAAANSKSFNSQVANTIEQLTKSVASWQALSDLADTKLVEAKASFPAKIAVIQAKIDAEIPKSANAHAKALVSTGVNLLNWTRAYSGYDAAIKRNQSSIELLNKGITRLQSTKDRAVAQIASLKSQLATTQASQPVLANQITSSVSQAKSQVKLACKVGI
jgi:hypothetical protein